MKNDIEKFPTEIVEKMLEKQVKQGNKRDIKVFMNDKTTSKTNGGFDWMETIEGHTFWNNIICRQNFSKFYDRYPKTQPYPKIMLVSDDGITSYPRVVFMEKNHRFLAWSNAESLEEADSEINVTSWTNAWDIPTEPSVKEVTLAEVAEAFGVDKIKIKE